MVLYPRRRPLPLLPAHAKLRQPQYATIEEPTQAPPNRLAPIELLPVEIIQDIFVRSLNLNLPLSSPVIASRLEDKHLYRMVCDHAFGYNVLTEIPVPMHLTKYQNQIFAMRWMRWEFFEDYISRRMPPRTCGCPVLIDCYDKGKTTVECTTIECQCNIPGCTMRRHNKESLIKRPKIRCSLPQKLLRGPWTDDKVKLLNGLLRISNMSVDWADKNAVRLAAQGKREAIMDRNLNAVHIFARSRRLGKAPNLELVKFAVLKAGCDRSIVLELMTAAREWGLRQWNDLELDVWVARQEAQGDPKGKWMRTKLEELRAGQYPDVKTGDYVGDALETRNSPYRAL